MTLASLAVTGSAFHRGGAGLPLTNATPLPFDDSVEGQDPDFGWIDRVLDDPGSGLDLPAASLANALG